MKDWAATGKNWRCAECLTPLRYLDLWQDASDGQVYCQDCWLLDVGADLEPFREIAAPPLVCDECAVPMPSSITQTTAHHWEAGPQLCESCRVPPSDHEVEEAVKGFLRVLEETSEDG